MTARRTYLDFNATAPLRPAAREAMVRALKTVGNPSSVHHEGRQARRLLEDAREQVATLVGATGANVVFTSGATEANNWVMRAGWDVLIFSDIEHDAVRVPARSSQSETVVVGAFADGVVDAGAIAEVILRDPCASGNALVSVQMANNETGVIQPVADIAQFCRDHGVRVHTDAVQAAGRLPMDMTTLDVDTMALSAHKIGGPMGVGALILREGVALPAMLSGGGHERSRRSGTENLAGIVGFGAAAVAALDDLGRQDEIRSLRDSLERAVVARYPSAMVMGERAERLANTTTIAFPGHAAETLVIKFDLAGIALSAGSACSSGKVASSHVLQAMGVEPEIARSAIRISLGWNSSRDDIDAFITACDSVFADPRQRAVA